MKASSISFFARARQYYRLAKPGIVYGNLIAAVAGFLLASTDGFNTGLFVATMVGTGLVIAAGCVFNNYTDIAIDSKMARTKRRALVTGAIKPRPALIYGMVLLALGFATLIQWTNGLTVLAGIVGIFGYVVLYAVAKRTTIHGTLVGTISGSMPPVAGYVAVTNRLDTAALLLFFVLVFWQMAHFYAIALFREADYKAAHIPVLPLVKGVRATKIQIILYIIAFIITTMLLPLYGYGGYSFAILLFALGCWWLYIAIKDFSIRDDTKWARKVFRFSLYVLLAFSLMLSLAHWLP